MWKKVKLLTLHALAHRFLKHHKDDTFVLRDKIETITKTNGCFIVHDHYHFGAPSGMQASSHHDEIFAVATKSVKFTRFPFLKKGKRANVDPVVSFQCLNELTKHP